MPINAKWGGACCNFVLAIESTEYNFFRVQRTEYRVQLPCGFSPFAHFCRLENSSLLPPHGLLFSSLLLLTFKITLTYFSLTLTYFLLTPSYFSPLPTSSQITPSNPPKTQNVKKSNLKASACLFFLLTLHG